MIRHMNKCRQWCLQDEAQFNEPRLNRAAMKRQPVGFEDSGNEQWCPQDAAPLKALRLHRAAVPDQDSDNEPNAPPSYAAATLRPPIGIQDCDGEPWERCGSDVMEIRDDRIECPIWPCTWTHFSDPENRYRNKGFPWAVQWMAWHFCDCHEEEDEVEGICKLYVKYCI